MSSRDKQVGGDHYRKHKIQPFDIIDEYELGFDEGNALKYLLRRKGNRLEDLQKAAHYLERLIEKEQARATEGPVPIKPHRSAGQCWPGCTALPIY